MGTTDRSAYSRTDVYLGPPGGPPKHMFVRIADIIERHRGPDSPFTLLDVGAANGEFARYALDRFPAAQIAGVEYDPALVEIARRNVPGATFDVGDANRLQAVQDACFDVVTMTGTHSIFDDFRPSFSECIRATRHCGTVIITGIFNPYPVDAQVYWRYGAQFEASWHPGYNLFSKLSVSSFLGSHSRVLSHSFAPFTIPFDIEPRADPIRSWTEPSPTRERSFRNGIMPLNFEMLTVVIGDS